MRPFGFERGVIASLWAIHASARALRNNSVHPSLPCRVCAQAIIRFYCGGGLSEFSSNSPELNESLQPLNVSRGVPIELLGRNSPVLTL